MKEKTNLAMIFASFRPNNDRPLPAVIVLAMLSSVKIRAFSFFVNANTKTIAIDDRVRSVRIITGAW
jgi:hypothetical protein